MAGAGNAALAGTLSGGGDLAQTGGGMTTLSGSYIYYTGPTTISNGTLGLANLAGGGGGKPFVSSINVGSAATLVLSNTSGLQDSMIVGFGNSSTAITGNGTIVETGSGWIEFDYNVIQGFSGQIDIQGGILGNGYGRSTWGASATGMGVYVAPGATLDLRGNGIAVGTLTGSGAVWNTYNPTPQATGSGILTVGLGDASSTFSGSIIGTGAGFLGGGNDGLTSLVKTGTGTFTLNGNGLTYTGPTTISAGTLVLADAATSHFASSISVAPAATLAFSSSNAAMDSMFVAQNSTTMAITGSGTIVKTGIGWTELCYNAIAGFSGQINIQSGILGNGDANSTWGAAPRAWGSMSSRGRCSTCAATASPWEP